MMSSFAIGLEDPDILYLEHTGFTCLTLKAVPHWARPSQDLTVYGGHEPMQAYVSDVSEQYPYAVTVRRV